MSRLKTIIDANIKENGNQEITGKTMNYVLNEIANEVNTDGYFPNMSVGFADNLVGRGESVPAEFTFRATGGKSIKDGAARIKRIKGNSVVWNQILNNLSAGLADKTETDTEVIIVPNSAEGNRYGNGVNVVAGHHYLQMVDILSEEGTPVGFQNYLNLDCDNKTTSTSYVQLWQIAQASASGTSYVQLWSKEGTPYRIKKDSFNLIDLTKMFGAGNEPTTIEEYNARKPIVEDEYAYNEGEVIHMNTESIKSVGDNAWDEEWEIGGIYTNNGESFDIDHNIRSKDYNRIIGGQEYSFLSAQTGALILYDEHYNYVDYWNIAEGQLRVLTIADNAAFFKICIYDYTYKHGTMLRLNHSGWKSDTGVGYEPYWQDILPLPIIRKYFPDGMKSAGSAHDEIRFNKTSGKWEAVQRIGSVDMSQFGWYQGSGFWASWNSMEFMADMKKPSDNGEVANICCKKYVAGSWTSVYEATEGNIAMYSDDGRIGIADSSIQSDADIMAATQGIILYYELAEPIITEIDEPFGTDYRVADFGTEQAQSSVPSAPFSADIIYQFNAVDMIRELWLKVQELESRVAQL